MEDLLKEVQEIYPEAVYDKDRDETGENDGFIMMKSIYCVVDFSHSRDTVMLISELPKDKDKILDVLRAIKATETK